MQKKITGGPGARNWDALAAKFMAVSRTLYHSQTMFGTFDVEPVVTQNVEKERRQRVKTQAVRKLIKTTIFCFT